MPPLSDDGRPPLHPGSPSSMYRHAIHPSLQTKAPLVPVPQRRVNFFPRVQVSEIPNIESHTPDESRQIWYTCKDIQRFENDADALARRVARRTIRRSECTRGLETRTPEGFHTCRSNRVSAVLTVLSVQHSYPLPSGAERVATAYMGVSVACKLHALDIAERDALEASVYLSEDLADSDSSEDENLYECTWLLPSLQTFFPFGLNPDNLVL